VDIPVRRATGLALTSRSFSIWLVSLGHHPLLRTSPATTSIRATVSGAPYSRINSGGLVAATLYDDATVKSGENYFYAVTTVDSSGVESRFCNQVKAVVPYP
jgi:hypothetical protein